MNYSKGISWFDDCRIPFVDESDNNTTRKRYDVIGYGSKMKNGWGSMDDSDKQGRFPPNLLCSDDMLNDTSRYYDIDLWFNNLLNNSIY